MTSLKICGHPLFRENFSMVQLLQNGFSLLSVNNIETQFLVFFRLLTLLKKFNFSGFKALSVSVSSSIWRLSALSTRIRKVNSQVDFFGNFPFDAWFTQQFIKFSKTDVHVFCFLGENSQGEFCVASSLSSLSLHCNSLISLKLMPSYSFPG